MTSILVEVLAAGVGVEKVKMSVSNSGVKKLKWKQLNDVGGIGKACFNKRRKGKKRVVLVSI